MGDFDLGYLPTTSGPTTRVLGELEISSAARDVLAEMVRTEIVAACAEIPFAAAQLRRIIALAQAARPFFASRDPMVQPAAAPVAAPSPLTETFGASALREITEVVRQSAVSKAEPSVGELVDALAVAKTEGLAGAQAMLQAKLASRLGVALPAIPPGMPLHALAPAEAAE